MHGERWQQTIRLDTAGYELSSLPDVRTGMVPQVVGMGLKDALYLLEREGLRVTFTGVGYIQKQSLPAGSAAKRGALIILQLGLERPEIEPEVSEPDSVGEEGYRNRVRKLGLFELYQPVEFQLSRVFMQSLNGTLHSYIFLEIKGLNGFACDAFEAKTGQ